MLCRSRRSLSPAFEDERKGQCYEIEHRRRTANNMPLKVTVAGPGLLCKSSKYMQFMRRTINGTLKRVVFRGYKTVATDRVLNYINQLGILNTLFHAIRIDYMSQSYYFFNKCINV